MGARGGAGCGPSAGGRRKRAGKVTFCLAERMFGQLQAGTGGEPVLQQILLALQVDAGKSHRLSLAHNIGFLADGALAQPGDLQACFGNRGIGLVERDLEWQGCDADKHVAALDRLTFHHQHLSNTAVDVGADRHLILLDIGIVGADAVARTDPEIQTDGSNKQWPGDHQ